MKRSFLTFVFAISVCKIFSQPQDILPKVTPIPPSAFQFLKYGEIPVSEYTGIPNISIPIYTIKDGDISFPISMSYHAGGLRVSKTMILYKHISGVIKVEQTNSNQK